MKIGFDISQTGDKKAGCGYFSLGLIQALAEVDKENQYILYPTFGNVYIDPNWIVTISGISKPNFKRGLGHCSIEEARRFWQNPPDDYEVQLGIPDIIHSNNFFCPASLRHARLVYTLYDLGFLHYPEFTTEENRVGCFSGVFNASLYADVVIAISEFTRKDFLDMFPQYPSERIYVVYPASRFSLAQNLVRPKNLATLSSGQFWLNVGTVEPRKNQSALLRSYAQLKRRKTTFPLVIAGGKGWLMDGLEKMVVDLKLEGNVILLGYVDNITLQWLYQNCFAFVYPSVFEGFGLPVVEAMALGAPVIASNATSLPEIVGETGVLVDPLNDNELVEAFLLVQLDDAYREGLRKLAVERAKQFSFARSARRVLEIYRTALEGVCFREQASFGR